MIPPSELPPVWWLTICAIGFATMHLWMQVRSLERRVQLLEIDLVAKGPR